VLTTSDADLHSRNVVVRSACHDQVLLGRLTEERSRAGCLHRADWRGCPFKNTYIVRCAAPWCCGGQHARWSSAPQWMLVPKDIVAVATIHLANQPTCRASHSEWDGSHELIERVPRGTDWVPRFS
jgi:hypothetical protein